MINRITQQRYAPRHVKESGTEQVQVIPSKDYNQRQAVRAILAAVIAGLGSLAASVTAADEITLAGGIAAAAAAAAGAGAVLGIRVGAGGTETTIPRRDMVQLRKASNGKDQRAVSNGVGEEHEPWD